MCFYVKIGDEHIDMVMTGKSYENDMYKGGEDIEK